MDKDFTALVTKIGQVLNQDQLFLTVAESCTGGMLAEAITSISGSSTWFERGFVTYSNQAKMELLGVNPQTLETYGAVSEQTAQEMAQGALTHSPAQLSIAISGIAGPEGGTPDKPVGTVWIAWAGTGKKTRTICTVFPGDRQAVRIQAVKVALSGLLEFISVSSE